MPFRCSICELDIQVGESMLADATMNLAHESCVRRKQDNPGSSVVVISSPAPPSTLTLTSPDACVPSRAPAVCVECGKHAISMCPACGVYVHQSFGYNGPACSLSHEQKCYGAKVSRDIATSVKMYTDLPKLKHPIFIGEPVIVIDPSVAPLFRKNGKSHGKAKARKKGIRR